MSESEDGSRGFFARVASLIREARRRKVWVTAAAYAALTIGLIEISGAVSDALLFPDWTDRLVTFLLILGFPVVLVMAWIFDFEKGGLKRTESLEELSRTSDPPRRRGDTKLVLGAPPIPEPVARRRRSSPDPSSGDARPVDPDRVKRVALGHVRHELRTPINAILGYSEMMLEDEDEDEIRGDLRRINESGRRLLALVDEILDPDRLAGPIERDIDSFASQIEADLRTPINAVIGYGEMLLEGERERGREALVPDLERVVTAARTLLESSGDIARIATRAPDAAGSAEGGRINDSSELTEGILARLESTTGTAGRIEGQGTLLVVDDNESNRDLLTRQLARYGYVVDTASDGAEALERLASREFDLILLDVIMPGMDGVQTLRELKTDERLRDIPVVMLSSLDEVESAVACIEAGAEEFITKPVQPTLLEARIAANLEVRRLREREIAYRRRIEADVHTIERLLLSAFPPDVARRVQAGEDRIVAPIPAMTVLRCAPGEAFARSKERLPEHLAVVSELFEEFSLLARDREVDVVTGGRGGFTAAHSDADAGEAAARIGSLAVAFRSVVTSMDEGNLPGFRFGIHTGAAVAAVIGRDRPRFDLWGDAVDTAERLARAADAGVILVSPSARTLFTEDFALEAGRVVEITGLGRIRPHILTEQASADAHRA